MIKIEMHSHTCFSQDGFITAETLSRQCRKKNLGCICITDHNTIQGAIEFSKSAEVKIVIGEEMETGEGDLIGLFLNREIDKGLGLEKTISLIKQQGGLVYLPHPFDEFRKSSVKKASAEKIKNQIDIIEIFNSRTLNPKYNRMAADFAVENGIIKAVGSDSHHPIEIGMSYVEMECFNGAKDFLEKLKKASLKTKKCGLHIRIYLKILKILTGKR